jgi:hypothetical protein
MSIHGGIIQNQSAQADTRRHANNSQSRNFFKRIPPLRLLPNLQGGVWPSCGDTLPKMLQIKGASAQAEQHAVELSAATVLAL